MASMGKLHRHQARTAYLFITPTMLLFLAFTVVPVIMALYLSFTNYDVLSHKEWVGTDNYRRLLEDSLYWQTFLNVTLYAVIFIPLNIICSLLIAMLMNFKRPGIRLFRTMNYLPTLTSAVAASTVWIWLLHPEFGLVNGLLSYVGIAGPAWLAQTETAMLSIIMVTLWQSIGSNMIIYIAGLQGIPDYLYESAKLDGASAFDRFRYITWPQLRPTTFLVSTMAIIGALQLFDQAFVLTQGGPGNVTKTPVYLIYQQGFNQLQMGYASAQAFVLAVVILIFSLINTRINKANESIL
ncbi:MULTISPECIES: carbohydrate ABC transporter permease [unclassified Paenibacillus]|uniref:carbohydrate ABC transporter permease n=1 Tax=unclassified Paenibacillus TaxID=185978 RepID=UPI001C103257|nr:MULTISPECIES: sugar ABC transporter permease [unclassified Paenibacillus]MBU5444504.1 sugar ABC transporter permease [Paenibacillus sp. MSJ-34]CAH0122325.1 Lactose transport system permease protein LacF [Paenibacillus sp. CECT 9249]